MKTTSPILLARCLAVLAAAAPLWSGVRIEVNETDLKTNQSHPQEFLLDATRLRANIHRGSESSILFLTDGGHDRIVILDSARNEYREMDQETANQVKQQMQGMNAQMQERLKNMPPEQRARIEEMMKGRGMSMPSAAEPPRTTYTETGSGSVNGFPCTKYVGMRGGDKAAEVCAAKPSDLKLSPDDFQIVDKMRQFATSLISGMSGQLANSPLATGTFATLTNQGYNGFPVQYTSFSGGQATEKTEVKSVQRTGLSDADFSLGSAKKTSFLPGRGRSQ